MTLPTDREIEDGEIARYERLLQNAADNLQASQSLLSLALGALEPFLRHLEPWMNERHPDERVTVFSRHTFGELRQASQVIAQIKGRQESMASSARNESK